MQGSSPLASVNGTMSALGSRLLVVGGQCDNKPRIHVGEIQPGK